MCSPGLKFEEYNLPHREEELKFTKSFKADHDLEPARALATQIKFCAVNTSLMIVTVWYRV